MSINKSDQIDKQKLRKIVTIVAIAIVIIIVIINWNKLEGILSGSNTETLAELPIIQPSTTAFSESEPIQTVELSTSEPETIEGTLVLHMIDVGQADSFLLVQNGHTALIDCGTRSTGEDVVKYLKKLGVTKLDYVIGTHPHYDHMGGMYDVITSFEIGKIIIPEVKAGDVTSNWYLKLMSEIKSGKYVVETPKLKQVYNLGDATMKVIGPLSAPKDNTNNYSIVFKVTFGEMDIIMTGDAEKDVEAEIIASGEVLDAEILKVGHHGSDTSTSKKWIEAIKPSYALISTKVGNRYHHPIKSTMVLLEEKNIIIYRTDECGTVVATITSSDVKFNTKPGDYLCGDEVAEK